MQASALLSLLQKVNGQQSTVNGQWSTVNGQRTQKERPLQQTYATTASEDKKEKFTCRRNDLQLSPQVLLCDHHRYYILYGRGR